MHVHVWVWLLLMRDAIRHRSIKVGFLGRTEEKPSWVNTRLSRRMNLEIKLMEMERDKGNAEYVIKPKMREMNWNKDQRWLWGEGWMDRRCGRKRKVAMERGRSFSSSLFFLEMHQHLLSWLFVTLHRLSLVPLRFLMLMTYQVWRSAFIYRSHAVMWADHHKAFSKNRPQQESKISSQNEKFLVYGYSIVV